MVAKQLGKFKQPKCLFFILEYTFWGVLLHQKVLNSVQKSKERAINNNTLFCNDIDRII